MHRSLLGAALALVAFAAPAPPASALGPYTLDLDATIACFGCGVTFGSLTGDVVAGVGGFRTGAQITGDFTHDGPPASCPITSSASGSMTTSDGYTTSFNLTRLGGDVLATFDDGSVATGTFVVTSPLGNPCGGPVTAHITLTGDDRNPPADPGPYGNAQIHRTAGGAVLLVEPATPGAGAWTCVDVQTGTTVHAGDALTTPDPGVACLPPAGQSTACTSLWAGGYFLPTTTSGAVTVTASCGAAVVDKTLTAGSPQAAGFTTAPVADTLPLRCETAESGLPATAGYLVFCMVNA